MTMECIAQGLVSYVGPPGALEPVWNGQGIELCSRLSPTGVLAPAGAVFLTLDAGLPGNSGAVPPGTGARVDPYVRTVITVRGDPTNIPPFTPVATKAVLYLPSGIVGVGDTTILIVTTDALSVLTDPFAMEVMVWRTF